VSAPHKLISKILACLGRKLLLMILATLCDSKRRAPRQGVDHADGDDSAATETPFLRGEHQVGSDREWKCDGSDLCAELSGVVPNEFSRTYGGQPATRILEETANIATVVDLSPLLEGHLLVAPKKHYLSFAAAMLDHQHEIILMLERASAWVRETYHSVALFEHGSTSDDASGACIEHAHIHVLPVAATGLVDVMRDDKLQLTVLKNIAGWIEIADTHRSYLLCSDGESFWVAYPQGPVRHQYLRSAAAHVIGMPDPYWDWALVVRKNLLRETIHRFNQGSDS
jgi:diadenosine tetraphosphate (Ap4A) HIT family hydrolase